MTESNFDDFLDNEFLGCAFAAYVELASATGGEPDSEATRRRAYQLYEQTLAERDHSAEQ